MGRRHRSLFSLGCNTVNTQNSEILYDSGREPLWVRLPLALTGMAMLWLAADFLARTFLGFSFGFPGQLAISGISIVVVSLVLAAMGYLFIALWFAETRLTFESRGRRLVLRTSSWWPIRCSQFYIPLDRAQAIGIELATFRAGRAWTFYILFEDGRREGTIRVRGAQPEDLAEHMRAAIGLPVVWL
jgi:hypothetical protein